jgi:'Cold-shock' DNA-binding domain
MAKALELCRKRFGISDAYIFSTDDRQSSSSLPKLARWLHLRQPLASGFRSLQEGQRVQFDVTKGPKGWQAENVQPV